MAAEADSATDVALRAIAHPARRRMLQLVWAHERTAGDLADSCGLTKPAASQHLRVLREASLVEVRAKANRRLYRARRQQLDRVRAQLDAFWGDRLTSLREAVADGTDRARGEQSS